MTLTPFQLREACKMRARGESWAAIGRFFHVRPRTVIYALYPERIQAVYENRKRRRRLKKADRSSPDPGNSVRDKILIPREVLFDRDRRMAMAPRNLTAALLGDPLPGRSALDRRGGPYD